MEEIRIINVKIYLNPSTSFEVQGINVLDSALMFTDVSAELANDFMARSIKSTRVTPDVDDSSSFLVWKSACSPVSIGKYDWLNRIIIKLIESWITISMHTSFLL